MYTSSFVGRSVCDNGLSKNGCKGDTGFESVKQDWYR